jgi:hypothetical protein
MLGRPQICLNYLSGWRVATWQAIKLKFVPPICWIAGWLGLSLKGWGFWILMLIHTVTYSIPITQHTLQVLTLYTHICWLRTYTFHWLTGGFGNQAFWVAGVKSWKERLDG